MNFKEISSSYCGTYVRVGSGRNLVQSYGEIYRSIFGIISAILLILMIVKIVKYPKGVAESLDNPVVASVFPTLSMGIMLLSTYCTPYAASFAYIMWIIGIALHIILILWFTKNLFLILRLNKYSHLGL